MKRESIQAGMRIGQLTVIGPTDGFNGKRIECVCDCGSQASVPIQNLVKSRPTQTCGCGRSTAHRKSIPAGTRFTRLVVIGIGERKIRGTGAIDSTSVCQCDCGQTKTIQNQYLRSGDTKSCGCLNLPEVIARRRTTHNRSQTREYRIWAAMITRCTNDRQNHWHLYGGRGISVCERWLNSFESFLEDMGDAPTDRHSIDRFPDKNGNYEKNNCRWATDKEQALNRRGNIRFTFYGKEMSLQEWAAISQVRTGTIIARLRLGWPEKEAVWTPAKRGHHFKGTRVKASAS